VREREEEREKEEERERERLDNEDSIQVFGRYLGV
jgi:hypothetical protein